MNNTHVESRAYEAPEFQVIAVGISEPQLSSTCSNDSQLEDPNVQIDE